MPRAKWVTQAEFARIAGVDRAEILRSIERGRIECRTVKGRKQINVTTELDKFNASCRHAGPFRDKPRATTQPKAKPKKRSARSADAAAGEADQTAPPIPPADSDDGNLRSKARAMREQYEAMDAAIDYERKAGTIVRVSEVEDDWRRIATLMKKAIMNIPDRLAPLVAAETTAQRCYIILDQECRLILEELADAVASAKLPGADARK